MQYAKICFLHAFNQGGLQSKSYESNLRSGSLVRDNCRGLKGNSKHNAYATKISFNPTSQTEKLMAGTKFSEYLDLNHCKKATKLKHFIHLRLTNWPQSLSTYHSTLPTVNSGHHLKLIYFKKQQKLVLTFPYLR